MNNDPKRVFLFFILSFVMIVGLNVALDRFGLLPQPAPPPPDAAQFDPDEPADADLDLADAPPAPEDADVDVDVDPDDPPPPPDQEPIAAEPPPVKVERLDADQLVLGALEDQPSDGYRLRIQLDQRGAGVETILSSQYNAEFKTGEPRKRPLMLVGSDPLAAIEKPSFVINLVEEDEDGRMRPLTDLDNRLWEVVQPVRTIQDDDGREGQEVVLRSRVTSTGAPAIEVTKTYRLWKGKDSFELSLGFEPTAEQSQTLTYKLFGPHGIPIEGKWYTHTFRDAFFGKQEANGTISVTNYSAYDIVKAGDDPKRNTQLPLAFAGIENQYFAVFFKPLGTRRIDAEATMTVVHENREDGQLSDVTVEMISRPFEVGPNQEPTHTFEVYAGPKTLDLLALYDAEELATYRKGWQIPVIGGLASVLARKVIAPLLYVMYDGTAAVAGWFGGVRGSYGIAIILLTVTVRLLMFPLSRKQAISAKKMQDLQPLMMELREKHKEDKEALTRETFALYRKYGINPLSGCLPVFIQLPIFIALWQALNNSVNLRQAPFLWINNLAAPDMLFPWPDWLPVQSLPLIGGFIGPYFNALPLVVVGLMMFQMKLFSPPATTPEQEMQQKVMKFMMVFMAFIFYKVPSGLAVYFITSSLWSVSERLLLPKVTHIKPLTGGEEDAGGKGKGSGPGSGPLGGGPNGNGPSEGGAPKGWLQRKLEKLMEEAAKDNTHRREAVEASPGRDRDRGRDGGKGRPKPRTRPGKRR